MRSGGPPEIGSDKEVERSERGAPGGIGSQSGEVEISDDEVVGERQMTFGPSRHGSQSESLPKGHGQGRIHFVTQFSELLGIAWDILQDVRSKMRQQLTTALENIVFRSNSQDIFPLPVSQEDPIEVAAMISGLNDLSDCSGEPPPPGKDDISALMKKRLCKLSERFKIWETPKPVLDFKTLFSRKDVDYCGEEVKVALNLSWEAVQASLPEGVGCLPLEDFCRHGTLEYVLNFEKYMQPPDLVQVPRPPKVMVQDGSWDDLCKGLVEKNICEIRPISSLYHHQGKVLLNGLFAVGKGEFHLGVETQRLIMNLTPVNALCCSLKGDVCTLPGLPSFSGFLLEEGEMALISSEDIRCFFYLFSLPEAWKPYLGFNKEVSAHLVPPEFAGEKCVLVSRVLPMGFQNSVSIAQHVHRNVVRWSAMNMCPSIGGEGEMRKDRGPSSASSQFRIYLDNFDQVERLDEVTANLVKGTVSAQVLKLREGYAELGLPRHPKKGVERQFEAEIQGAWFDGKEGFAMPKVSKVWQYCLLGLELLERGSGTLKELQVVCGGFVYMAMFRRPLLCSLNEVWKFMEKLKAGGGKRQVLPNQVKAEIARFVTLSPLAQMEFRSKLCEQVTCSDASTLGGGICVSRGLTAYGASASNSLVRGDIPEQHDMDQVLTVGMFDGIGALRVATDVLGLPMAGHVSIERDLKGKRVVESWFPDTIFYDDVQSFGEEQVKDLAMRFSNVALIILGAGPPCQGVSGLNADKKGALLDSRSSLFQEIPRIHLLLKKHFPWAQVHRLMESVASMSAEDRQVMTSGVGDAPFKIDAYGLTLCHRPRLYWPSWELQSTPGAVVAQPVGEGDASLGMVSFFGATDQEHFLEAGWSLADDWGLPTFTTSRPREHPGRRPAGLHDCSPHERERWEKDQYRFPPYQYKDGAGLVNKRGEWRRPNVAEREALMGFPVGYTQPCLPKQAQQGQAHEDARLSLLGNSWQVGVVVWLLHQLCQPLGLCGTMEVEDIIRALSPGQATKLQTLLLRPPLNRQGSIKSISSQKLVRKLLGIVSMKGEDLLLQADSEQLVKYHRLRASIPGKLWRWSTVAGWAWKSSKDHINVLELRAILTSVRWWVRQRNCVSSKFLHLTDSLVCLHCLSRGRTSSAKLRRTLIKINALLLAADLHPMWGYIHTKQNPADRPSRRPFRRKWVRR